MSIKDDDNNLENFFRKASGRYDGQFNEDDWKKMERMLDEEGARAAGVRLRRFRRGVFAIVACMVVGIVSYFVLQHSKRSADGAVPATSQKTSVHVVPGSAQDTKNGSLSHEMTGAENVTGAEDKVTREPLDVQQNNSHPPASISETDELGSSDAGIQQDHHGVTGSQQARINKTTQQRATGDTSDTGVNNKRIKRSSVTGLISSSDNLLVMNDEHVQARRGEHVEKVTANNTTDPGQTNSVVAESTAKIFDHESMRDRNSDVERQNNGGSNSIEGVHLRTGGMQDATHEQNRVPANDAEEAVSEHANQQPVNNDNGRKGDNKDNGSALVRKAGQSESITGLSPEKDSVKQEKDSVKAEENTKAVRETAEPVADQDLGENRGRVPGRWSVAVKLAPDLSSSGFLEHTTPGGAFGVMIQYNVFNRLSVVTGAINAKKMYWGSGDEYHPPQGYWNRKTNGIIPKKINGTCMVLEIPLTLRYDLMEVKKNVLYVSAGVSSYLMQKEHYRYEFEEPNPGAANEWTSRKSSWYWFDVGHVSLGIERKIGNRLSAGIEPYFKIPFVALGWPKINLYTAGVYLSVRYTFLKRGEQPPSLQMKGK